MTRAQTIALTAVGVVAIAFAGWLLIHGAEKAAAGVGAGGVALLTAGARKRDRKAVVKAEVRAVEQLAERGRALETDTARLQREARTAPKGETPAEKRDRLRRLASDAARKRGGR